MAENGNPLPEAPTLKSETPGANAVVTSTVIQPGVILKDRYVIERQLGHGGIGAVYIARDQELVSRRVVIKFLLDTVDQDPWFLKKFKLEMEALARIDHPGVVGILDAGETAEGKPFLVIQFIEGRDLGSVIDRNGVDLDRTADIIRQIGHALTAAHDKGIIHRDLKPQNIMLQTFTGGEEVVKLIDFGIATVKDSQSATNRETNTVVGSLVYMSPEQLMGKPTPQSDIYALGVIAYEMVTGRVPFQTKEAVRLYSMQQSGVSVKPIFLRDELPEAAQDIILRALAFDPKDRYQRACDFADELHAALKSQSTVEVRINPPSAPVAPPPDTSQDRTLEVAHVLFMDLVSYSNMPTDEQTRAVEQLQALVRSTPEFVKANAAKRLISLPTGDGMALAFFQDPMSPVQCALQLAGLLKQHLDLPLRMGIHSGPVYRVADINTNWNVAGGGINMAQRVMDCGDAGHILVSKTVADVLSQLSGWSTNLTDLGVQEVKHGVRLHIFSLRQGDLGNPSVPQKLRAKKKKGIERKLAVGALILVAVAGLSWGVYRWAFPQAKFDSLAVLPLVNVKADPKVDYLSDGITENLTNSLSRLPRLNVISNTAVQKYKGNSNVDPQVVGSALNAQAILTGTIVQNGDHLIVTAELVDARNRKHLWGERYDRLVPEFRGIQDEIAESVSAKLANNLTADDKRLLTKRYTENPEASLLYQQGRYFWNKRTQDNFRIAIDYFNQAIQKDPDYALAYSGLADTYSMQSGVLPPKEVFPKAELAAMKAVTKDDSMAEAHAALAFVKMYYDWDWPGSEKEFKRALELNPKYANAHSQYAGLLEYTERFDEAIAERKRAQQLDPTSVAIALGIARVYDSARKYDTALEYYKKALQMDPNMITIHRELGSLYAQKGMLKEAGAEFAKEPGWPASAAGIAIVSNFYARSGMKDKALEGIRRLEEMSQKRYVSPCNAAAIHAGLGDKEKAIANLNTCYDDRSWEILTLKINPVFDGLRQDSRFIELLKKLKLAS